MIRSVTSKLIKYSLKILVHKLIDVLYKRLKIAVTNKSFKDIHNV